MDKLNKDQIRNLLPHREPMLLVDELYDIKKDPSQKLDIVNVDNATKEKKGGWWSQSKT